jgi:hypothetical protein
MRRVRQLIARAALFALISATITTAHDEPPKTMRERAEQEQTREKMRSLGVKSQTISVIKTAGSDGVADSSRWLTNEYDQAGNRVKQTVYDTSGVTRSISVFDDRSSWLEELTFVDDYLRDRTVFLYDRHGLISHVFSYDDLGELTGRLDYTYSSTDPNVFIEKRNQRDSLLYSILYRYEPGSDFRRQVDAVQTGGSGSPVVKVENEYILDKRSRKSVLDPDGKLTHTFSYTYTPGGDLSEVVKRLADDSIAFRQGYQYTQEGLLSVITERDGSGAVKRRLCYAYEFFRGDR